MSKRPGPSAAPRNVSFNSVTSTNSYHAGAPIPTLSSIRRQSSYRYQTFPTQPPKTPLEQPRGLLGDGDSDTSSDNGSTAPEETPLPVKQLLLLAFLSLAEQTALNSISPYLPEMVGAMPGIPDGQTGLYVGILASSFAFAQLSTNFAWGYASDVIGRKPVLLLGTFCLMCCFTVFGLCRRYWQVVLVHIAMGMLNGNAACVPTVLGELTDRSNQSKAFTYLPVIYSLGSITGPAVGGVLVGRMGGEYPYLGPNVLGASLLAAAVIVIWIWFEETLDHGDHDHIRPAWIDRVSSWFSWIYGKESTPPPRSRGAWSARWPRGQAANRPLLDAGSESDTDDDNDATHAHDDGAPAKASTPDGTPWSELLNSTTLLLLCTYLVFQLSNISYNSLYPIFASSPAPTGRDLNPSKIGLSLSVAGAVTIIFQAFVYQPIKGWLGNLGTYRISLLGIAISMVLMPWVGYMDDKPLFGIGTGKMWLYAELGLILILKNICAVGGLSSVMLLITNSAPSHASLGTLNGLAQTLSALGRSFGPFVSGGLFTLSVNIKPKGEALAWCVFGGLAVVGFAASLFIRGDGLESDDWLGDDEHEDNNVDEERAQ